MTLSFLYACMSLPFYTHACHFASPKKGYSLSWSKTGSSPMLFLLDMDWLHRLFTKVQEVSLLSKRFYDILIDAAARLACCGSFVRGSFSLLVASYKWMWWTHEFTWFKPPERNTLRPWENWVVLLKPALTEPFFNLPREEAPARAFYSSRSGSYIETRGPTGSPWWLKPYTSSMTIMVRSIK
jgi:hypothetical protein